MDVVNYVQYNRFGAAVDLLKRESPNAFDSYFEKIRLQSYKRRKNEPYY